MLDNTDESNSPPTVEEGYASAASATNLRVDADRRTPADMVIAAGMNTHRMGLALTRLMSEWDASAKPAPMDAKAVEVLARRIAESRWKTAPGVWLRIVHPLDLQAAQVEAVRWHAHELGLLFQRMKSLQVVREGLIWQAQHMLDVEDGQHVVAAVLQWWLHKTCPTCDGRRFKVVAGTGRVSSKLCTPCKGTGERKVPHGWQGRKVLAYMNECRASAMNGLKGKFRHHQGK